MRQFHDLAEAQVLALAIVDTLPEPFLVLDDKLQVLTVEVTRATFVPRLTRAA